MTVLSDYVARMVEAGMDQSEAMQIVAEVFAAGAANVPARSSNALRQQRYRDNKKRNESVTNRNAVTPDETVTNRNETVTNRNDVTPPPISSNKLDKKEKRGTQIPDGWRPDEGRLARAYAVFGKDRAELEIQKFIAHHGSKGTVFKNWQLGWDKWAIQAQQWWLPKGAASTPSHTPSAEIDWKSVLSTYKKTGHWSRWAGPDPETLACKAPPELLREFGLLKSA